MTDTARIGGYEATIHKVGYISIAELSNDDWSHLRICYGVDETNLINVETAIDLLRERTDEHDAFLTESEQKLLQICKEAEIKGIGDIVINPP